MSKQGKKKGKVLSLSEFHAQVPETTSSGGGSSAAPAQPSNYSWADVMEQHDETGSEPAPPPELIYEVRSKLPTFTKASLAPDIDLEAIPKKPPFTAHLSNVSFEADESKIKSFFRDSKILMVRLPVDERGRFRGHGFVDFEDRDSLIAALGKNDSSFFNRQIKVTLEGSQKREFGQGRQGGGGPQGEQRSDEADWRRHAPVDEPQQSSLPSKSQSFHYNNNNSNNEFRQNRYHQQQQPHSGGGGGGYQQRRSGGGGGGGGYQQQQQFGQQQWSNRNEGGGGGGGGSGSGSGQIQRSERRPFNNYNQKPFREPRTSENRDSVNEPAAGEGGSQTQALEKSESKTEMTRPKLNLIPRSLPTGEIGAQTAAPSSSIFGSAKPVNTAAREREIEERLKREREELAERAEKEKQEQQQQQQQEPTEVAGAPENQVEEPQQETRRTHRTSYTSDDSRHHQQKSQDNEFQVVGASGKPRPHHKNDNNNNNIRHQRIAQSASFTSPPSASSYNQSRREPQHQYQRKQEHHDNRHRESAEPSKPQENPWKSRQAAAELFSKPEQPLQHDSSSSDLASRPFSNRPPREHNDDHQNPRRPNTNPKRPDFGSNRPTSNRDNKDRRNNTDRNKPLNKNPRSDKPVGENSRPIRPKADGFALAGAEQSNSAKHESALSNKFAGLTVDEVDVDTAEEIEE